MEITKAMGTDEYRVKKDEGLRLRLEKLQHLKFMVAKSLIEKGWEADNLGCSCTNLPCNIFQGT